MLLVKAARKRVNRLGHQVDGRSLGDVLEDNKSNDIKKSCIYSFLFVECYMLGMPIICNLSRTGCHN